uniref:malate dehydrogenase n=1 Tax=Leersia perrieri TaxID=77586 RepID=A0A0D9X1T8_9ORYZ
MASAAMSTLNLTSSPLNKQQLRLGAATLTADHVSSFSSTIPAPSLCYSSSSSRSHWQSINPTSRRNPWRRAGINRVVAKSGAGGGYKVAILGAAGGIGQPLSLLIKMSPLVSSLHLYDIANIAGVTADLAHCNTPAKVAGFTGKDELAACLAGADVVVIPAGVPRKPGMTRDDLFGINAGIVRDLAEAVADHAPAALVHVITNPINSTVPIAAEVLKQKGVYDARKVFGVTTLDVVRANTFVAAAKRLPLADVDVPVVGGHAAATILPLLSKSRPKIPFTDEEVEALTRRIQNAGTEVVDAKAGDGSATLSMAYAAARFVEASLRGLDGDGEVYECAFVQCGEAVAAPELPFFACRVRLGRDGVEEVMAAELKGISDYEARALEALKPLLKKSIDKGIAFARQQPAAPAPAMG